MSLSRDGAWLLAQYVSVVPDPPPLPPVSDPELEPPLLLHAAAPRAMAGTVAAAMMVRERERSLTSDSLVLSGGVEGASSVQPNRLRSQLNRLSRDPFVTCP